MKAYKLRIFKSSLGLAKVVFLGEKKQEFLKNMRKYFAINVSLLCYLFMNSLSGIKFLCRFHTPLGQFWGLLAAVHRALLLQGTRGILQLFPHYLYQEQTTWHPLHPLQRLAALLLSEMLGCQVRGIRFVLCTPFVYHGAIG